MRARSEWDRAKILRVAEDTLEEKLTELKRLVTSIRFWQRRVRYYTRELEKSDEERAAERAEREGRARQTARAQRRIKL